MVLGLYGYIQIAQKCTVVLEARLNADVPGRLQGSFLLMVSSEVCRLPWSG